MHHLTFDSSKTASIIATSIVHSKLDCCNSILQSSNLSTTSAPTDSELSSSCYQCHQGPQILAYTHVTPVLKPLPWFKI